VTQHSSSSTQRATVTIKGGPESWRYEVAVNGEKVGYLRAVDFHADPGNLPRVSLDVIGSVEFDGLAEVEIISQYARAMRALMAVKQWSLDNGNPVQGIIDALGEFWVELS
jgi:hypothetical protein